MKIIVKKVKMICSQITRIGLCNFLLRSSPSKFLSSASSRRFCKSSIVCFCSPSIALCCKADDSAIYMHKYIMTRLHPFHHNKMKFLIQKTKYLELYFVNVLNVGLPLAFDLQFQALCISFLYVHSGRKNFPTE